MKVERNKELHDDIYAKMNTAVTKFEELIDLITRMDEMYIKIQEIKKEADAAFEEMCSTSIRKMIKEWVEWNDRSDASITYSNATKPFYEQTKVVDKLIFESSCLFDMLVLQLDDLSGKFNDVSDVIDSIIQKDLQVVVEDDEDE